MIDRRNFKTPENTLHEFDVDGIDAFDNAHALFKGLREGRPVAHTMDFEGFWLLTKYDAIEALSNSSTIFTGSMAIHFARNLEELLRFYTNRHARSRMIRQP